MKKLLFIFLLAVCSIFIFSLNTNAYAVLPEDRFVEGDMKVKSSSTFGSASVQETGVIRKEGNVTTKYKIYKYQKLVDLPFIRYNGVYNQGTGKYIYILNYIPSSAQSCTITKTFTSTVTNSSIITDSECSTISAELKTTIGSTTSSIGRSVGSSESYTKTKSSSYSTATTNGYTISVTYGPADHTRYYFVETRIRYTIYAYIEYKLYSTREAVLTGIKYNLVSDVSQGQALIYTVIFEYDLNHNYIDDMSENVVYLGKNLDVVMNGDNCY